MAFSVCWSGTESGTGPQAQTPGSPALDLPLSQALPGGEGGAGAASGGVSPVGHREGCEAS